jgi:predicted lipid-binding transport protein (Tim44 family)
MSNQLRLLSAALAAVLAMAVAPAVAPAAVTSKAALRTQTTQARFSGRFFRRAPVYRSRPRAPYRRAYRPSPFHGFFGGILKMLGIAYLAHLLFGWGAGGSPFGLLIFAAVILWLSTRRRRRPAYW